MALNLVTIQSIAKNVGFDACGVNRVEKLSAEEDHLKTWLSQGMHGEMGYMERNVEKRIDPAQLVPGAKSIVSVLLSYFPGNPNISTIPPKISRYALSVDYHNVIKQMLWEMLKKIRENFGEVNCRAFVDSAPVLERAWAAKSGLGWIGKNGLLINPEFGSYTFIGELILDIDIEPSKNTVPNHCGTCTRCIDSCPTGAIVAPGIVDARKCISYLTIEKKSELTDDEKSQLNDWCFGCDICQEACPWNAKISISNHDVIKPKSDVLTFNSKKAKELNETEFTQLFGDTPVARSSFKKFIQNSRISSE